MFAKNREVHKTQVARYFHKIERNGLLFGVSLTFGV